MLHESMVVLFLARQNNSRLYAVLGTCAFTYVEVLWHNNEFSVNIWDLLQMLYIFSKN